VQKIDAQPDVRADAPVHGFYLASIGAARRSTWSLGVSSHHRGVWSILFNMKVATGKIVGGKVVLEGVALEEGATVTVLANDDAGDFDLTPDQERELLLSIAEADQGETVSAEEVLAKLARRHG
jgi:hypothetical protein